MRLPVLEFRILGPFEVVEGGRPLALGGPKQRALLAILVLRRDGVVSSDRLIDLLWGERPPATAAKTLQGYVSNLRKALGADVIVTRGGGYQLMAAPEQVDAERFERLVAEAARAGDPAAARERLGEALALWRGEALADLAFEPFAQGEVARLQDARLAAIEDRIDADMALGRDRDLVGELEALVAENPHRERLLGQLMLALYRGGRQADALAAFRRGRDALDETLGLEPGPELRALEQRILTHDEALGTPARSAPVPGAPSRRLIVAGGALLLVAAVAAAVAVSSGGGGTVELRAQPNSLAAIDTHANRVVGQVPVGARPRAITAASGSLWVANLDDETVSRVDPGTLRTLRTLPVGGTPNGIAAAGGRVWVVENHPGERSVAVDRIDPRFDAVDHVARIATINPGDPGAIAARGDALWAAPSSGLLTRLDAATGRVATQVDPNAGPTGIGVAADAVWVTDGQAGNVTRVDPTGLVSSLAVGHQPSGIAVGQGGIWVADTGDDAVLRIDPDTRSVAATVAVGRAPTGVAIGDGSVW
ncbi:MAG: hypothetical protein QOI15_454, partial [Pseudonocardiales bacterium]|nr:hypothetical protein [Pseudonocardiales bacterium]